MKTGIICFIVALVLLFVGTITGLSNLPNLNHTSVILWTVAILSLISEIFFLHAIGAEIGKYLLEKEQLVFEKGVLTKRLSDLIFFTQNLAHLSGIPEKQESLAEYFLGIVMETNDLKVVTNCVQAIHRLEMGHVIDKAIGDEKLDPSIRGKLLALKLEADNA